MAANSIAWRGGRQTSYSFALSSGDLNILTPAALATDAATARTDGSFQKLVISASRLQHVTESVSLYAAINEQIASKNLDISEKMGLGGPYAVRAYPVGEGYGDQGFVVNLEARLLLPRFSQDMPGQMHLIGFVDAGKVFLNKRPFAAGPNHRTLRGAGVGFTWAESNNFSVKAYWAHKLGNAPATSAPDKQGRFWIQLGKYF